VLVVAVGLFLFSGEPLGGDVSSGTTVVTVVDDESVARGMFLAEDSGCLVCHTVDGTPSTGPTWKGLYQSSRPLYSGESVLADGLYMLRSITDPGAQIVAGFDNVMPATFADSLSSQDISDLVEYVKSLG
jgi:cytochrome c oxidase subunit 2